MKLSLTLVLFGAFMINLGCGGGNSPVVNSNSLSGNWVITLNRHANSSPQIFSGFLLQSGSSVIGSVILGNPCQGVGPVSGSVNKQGLALTINEFGQDLTLTGPAPSSNTTLSGQFSTLAGGCTLYPNTGTWTGTKIPPVTGRFIGTFVSNFQNNGTTSFTGSITQGANIGSSNTTLTGSLQVTGTTGACSYISSVSINGLISGTAVSLGLFNSSGAEVSQIPGTATVDGKSISGTYTFPILGACPPDQGSFQLALQ